MSGKTPLSLMPTPDAQAKRPGTKRLAPRLAVPENLSLKPVTHAPITVLAAVTGGCVLMGLVNSNIGATVLAVLLLGAGLLVSSIISWGRFAEVRAFLLTFGVCLLVAGCLQAYSEAQFQMPMSTMDAWTFYHSCVSGYESDSLDSLEGTINAPLAVIFWQTWYALAASMGFGKDPFIGIELNACFVGLAAAVTVKCGREIYGSDLRRLNGIANLCATCGMFWLFGAVFLRDCFSLFFSSLILWALVRWLCVRCNLTQLVILSGVLLLSTSCLLFLRRETVYTALPLILLAAFVKFIVNSKHVSFRLLLSMLAAVACVGIVYKSGRMEQVWNDLSDRRMSYGELGSANSGQDSLGMRLVVSQPLPIRAAVGSLMLILNPLPIWVEISDHMTEYHFLKSYQGLFMIWLFPWTLAGVVTAFRRRSGPLNPGQIYLSFYAVGTLAAIAITSMETRHHGQFLPAFLLLAVTHDQGTPESREIVTYFSSRWWMFVVAVYVAWAFLKLR